MKYCQECGKEMFDDQVICPNCGTYQMTLGKDGEQEMLEPLFEEGSIEPAEISPFGDVSGDEFGAEPSMPSFEASEPSEPSMSSYEPSMPSYEPSKTSSTTNMPSYTYGQQSGPESEAGQPVPTYQSGAYDKSNNSSQFGGAAFDSAAFGGAAYGTSGDPRFNNPNGGQYPIRKYNFWLYLLLGLITCGVYNIYLMYKWTEDTNRLSQGVYKPSMNYIAVFLLSIVTCGIYNFVWVYQQGERLKIVGEANGIKVNESGIHHLLITLLLGGIGPLISTYIFFSNTNRLSGVYNGEITRDQANIKTSHVPAIIIGIVLGILGFSTAVGTSIYFANNYAYDYTDPYSSFDFDDFDDFDDYDDLYYDGDVTSLPSSAMYDEGAIMIEDAEVILDANGDLALAVNFYWENNGDMPASPIWAFVIEAEQSGKMLELTFPAVDDPYYDINAYMDEVEPGASVLFPVCFKLDNADDPVDVYARDILTGENNEVGVRFTLPN